MPHIIHSWVDEWEMWTHLLWMYVYICGDYFLYFTLKAEVTQRKWSEEVAKGNCAIIKGNF